MSINEFQKAYSEKGRDNFDKAFCPFGYDIGEHFQICGDCFKCKEEKKVSFESCEKKYNEFCERGK